MIRKKKGGNNGSKGNSVNRVNCVSPKYGLQETITGLARRNIVVRVDGGDLTLTLYGLQDNPEYALKSDLLDAVRCYKDILIRYYTESSSPNACPACWKIRWWTRSDGGKVCDVCHPDPKRLRAEHENKTSGVQKAGDCLIEFRSNKTSENVRFGR